MTFSVELADSACYHSFLKLIPADGFYEDFSSESFRDYWTVGSGGGEWTRSEGCLKHTSSSGSKLQLTHSKRWNTESAGIHLHVSANIDRLAYLTVRLNQFTIEFRADKTIVNGQEQSRLGCLLNSSLLLIGEGQRLFLFHDGQLLIDREFTSPISFASTTGLDMTLAGEVIISKLIVFTNPRLTISYKNWLHEDVQIVELVDSRVSIVTEVVRDAAGRQIATTKPTRVPHLASQACLAFHSDFVTSHSSQPRLTGKFYRFSA